MWDLYENLDSVLSVCNVQYIIMCICIDLISDVHDTNTEPSKV